MKHQLLFDSHPVVLIPDLAEAIGLNEAIVLQQVHYWLNRTKHIKDGKPWVYNSMREWHEQFRWWSIDTVKRTFFNLEKQGLLITGSFNRAKFDKTKWYTIDYRLFDQIVGMHQSISANCTNGEGQIAPMEDGKLHQPIPETNTEINPENTNNKGYEEFKEQWDKIKVKMSL